MTEKTPPEDPFDAAVTEERLPARFIAKPIERTPDPPLSDPYAAAKRAAPQPVAPETKRAAKQESEPPASVATSKPRRWLKPLLVTMALLLSVLGFGATYVALNFENLVRGSVTSKAKERGFTIRVGEIEAVGLLPWESEKPSIVMRDVKLTGTEYPDLEIEAESLEIALGGTFPSFEPQAIVAKNAFINAPDVPSLVALEKSAKEGALSKTPFTLKGARLRVGSLSEALPVTVVARASEIAGTGGAIRFSDVSLELPIPFVDLKLGPASADVERALGKTSIRFDDLKAVTFSLDDQAKQAIVDLAPLSSSVVDKLIGTDLPEMTLSGNAVVDVSKKEPSGTFSALLDGYIPPHPRELNGIVFGKKTKVTGSFHLEGKTIKLDSIAIEAGAFKLAGAGKLTLDNGGFMTLELKGSVPCADLASSAIGSHLGSAAGLITGGLASGRLGGTVGVNVSVEAKLTDIEHAKVIPSAYISCKLSLGF
mgnify:CR=1 FL=1